jgi:type II secretory pathway predicted ATPase ExeA
VTAVNVSNGRGRHNPKLIFRKDEPPPMYVDHFKLQERPFANSPGTGYFLPAGEFEMTIARIQETLLARDAVAVLTGGPGVGKSSIVAHALKIIEDRAIAVYVDMRQIEPELLYDMMLLSLGAESNGGDIANSLSALRLAIQHHYKNDRRVTAVIDISGLTVERAKRLLRLVHMAGEPGSQLNVILLGPHTLHRLLDSPGLIHIRQRVGFRCRIRPLTSNETTAYIRHQLDIVGGEFDQMLSADVANAVYRYVSGVPRLINTLMDACLSEAAVHRLKSLKPTLIDEVAADLGWKPLVRTHKRPAPPKPAAASVSTAKMPELARPASDMPPPRSNGNSDKDSTGRLLAEAGLLDAEIAQSIADDTSDTVAQHTPAAAAAQEKSDDDAPSPYPEMSASDTSATGMLKLEDLDAQFAESAFGDDTGMFNVTDSLRDKLKKAAGKG